ncbi:MAG: sortase [Patescibacteria group bacterium]
MFFKSYRYEKGPEGRHCYGEEMQEKDSFFGIIFPMVLVFAGSFILATQIFLPLLSFFPRAPLARPLESDFSSSRTLGWSVVKSIATSQEQVAEPTPVPPFFSLSIPKLGIVGARVKKNTTDPDPEEFLGHFKGSALPGDSGTVFIYGHSTFPSMYDPEDYRAIFSRLDQLAEGDAIMISYPGEQWEYLVDRLEVMKPSEVDEIDFSSRLGGRNRLVLMTCYPLGTRFKRLLVFASPIERD